MTDAMRMKIISAFFVFLIGGSLVLIVYGLGKTYVECKDKGGEVVRGVATYKCIGEDE